MMPAWGAMTETPFSTRLREAIAARYGTQKEGWFADHIGMSRTHLSRVLNNPQYRPEMETVRRYADGLGLDPAEVARWIPGYIVPDEPAPPREPVPSVFQDAFTELDFLSDDEIVAYVESKPGEYFRAEMARQKARRTRASYVNLCRAIMRAWTSNAQLAIDASLLAEK